MMQHLNPRGARVVALSKPSDVEVGQWYFQRYVQHFPTKGEMVLFDRSWYNRAGVEKVMGFCSDDEYEQFMQQAPLLEKMWVDSGIHLVKLWFAVGQEEQRKRFMARETDPLKQWKLSPIDKVALNKWDDYTQARDNMFVNTNTDACPWNVIYAEDKKRARLEAMKCVLNQFDYDEKNHDLLTPDSLIIKTGASIFKS